MTILLAVILFLTLFHFIYESVILPTLRLRLRYKLFALRDELRKIKALYGERLDNKTFEYLQSGLNNAINLLPYIDTKFAVTARLTISGDKELRERIKRRVALLDKCDVKEIIELRKKTYSTVEDIFLANSGGWFIYVVPVIGVFVFFEKVKNLAIKIIVVPESEIDKIAATYSLRATG